jgi:hypothetical protein
VTDPILQDALHHLERDHERDEKLDRATRFAEALTYDASKERHDVGVELQQILGEP